MVASKRRLLVVVALLAVCFLWLDAAVYRYLHANFNENTRPIPDLLKLPHRILRSMEDWGENVFIVAVLFAMWRLDVRRRGRVVCLVVGAALTAVAVEGLKRSTGRVRPDVSQGATVFDGPVRIMDDRGVAHSFPSGHTASAGAYGGALAAFYPPLRPAMVVMACGTGASRVWKERHFLSDCLAGGVLGWWIAAGIARGRRWKRLCDWCDARLAPREMIAVPSKKNGRRRSSAKALQRIGTVGRCRETHHEDRAAFRW